MTFAAYLQPSEFIDHQHPLIAAQARALAQGLPDDAHAVNDLVRRCFEFVRDDIKHSGDFMLNPLTVRASDVLRHGTGFCYAKSHLLAALLRFHGIPTGLCYQRLSVKGDGGPYCLHGLNAVHLGDLGWYRIDPRGNKPGVSAQFSPPVEQLAFAIQHPQERDFPEIWPEPLPIVVEALTRNGSTEAFFQNYPDIEVVAA